MVWHWVNSGSIYAVWNCMSHSVVKLVVLSCWSVACGSACCVPTFSDQLCNCVCLDGIQQVGPSYVLALGVLWV